MPQFTLVRFRRQIKSQLTRYKHKKTGYKGVNLSEIDNFSTNWLTWQSLQPSQIINGEFFLFAFKTTRFLEWHIKSCQKQLIKSQRLSGEIKINQHKFSVNFSDGRNNKIAKCLPHQILSTINFKLI